MLSRNHDYLKGLLIVALPWLMATHACLMGGGDAPSDGEGGSGRDPASASGNPSATGGTGGASGTGGSNTGGSDVDGGGGTGAGGSLPDPDGGPGGDPVIPSDPDFEGIDVSVAPAGKPPPGCAGGYDAAAGSLTLTLDDTIRAVFVSVVDGDVQANGVVCTASNGSAVRADALTKLTIQGTDGDDTVILDSSSEPLGHVLDGEQGILTSLGDGYDALLLRASRQADDYWLGVLEEHHLFDLRGDGVLNLQLEGVDVITVSLGPGQDRLLTEPGGEEAEYETPWIPMYVYGGDDDDVLQGSTARDIMSGGTGDDDVSGRGGNDWFDARTTGDGMDVFNGGDGSDTISYVDRTSDLRLVLCEAQALEGCEASACSCPADNGEAGEGDTLVNIESAHGGAGSDEMIGTGAGNVFFGHDGEDYLEGGDGNDFLFGDFHDDVLLGGAGDDYLDGAMGNDVINGGESSGDICIVEAGEAATECELY